jgi:tetratricopeptide (TPR) repeat protein
MHAILAALVLSSIDASVDPQAFQRTIARSTPAAQGIPVEQLRIDLGPASLTIERGKLVPVEGAPGRTQELLVLGEARFALSTDDPVESYQIELYSGERRIDLPVTRAVLVIPNDEVVDALLARPGRSALSPAELDAARGLLASWRASPEFRRAAADLTLVEDAAGEPLTQGAVVAWCHGERLGTFIYTVDPFAVEQVRLERFVAVRLGAVDADRLRRGLRREEEEGRNLGRRVEDIGDWDTWFSSSLKSPGAESFEPEHYDIALTVASDLEEVRGVTKIRLAPRTRGARVAHFELFDDLILDSIHDPSGATVPWARSGSTISAFLPEPVEFGSRLTLELRYHGVLFRKVEPALRSRRSSRFWYPRVGTIDRATYRAQFVVPEALRILASGRRIAESVEGGHRKQTRTLDLPTRFFGFEVGRYDVLTRKIGHVELEIGFLRDAPAAGQQDRAKVIETIADALVAYEEAFGPYPLDVLTVAATPGTVSRGYLSLLTLAQPIVDEVALERRQAVEAAGTMAHELAHQWWGNMVGWTSYRDQWLSEALADYASALYRNRLAAHDADRFPRPNLVDAWTDVGRPVEALGPVMLGLRLSSSLSDTAYHAIVYDKGSMVFAMLADKLGEVPLLGMLREIAQRTNHRDIDTDTFLRALEKMSGKDLRAFSRSFVEGIGYPEIQVEYERQAGPDGMIEGMIRQIPRGYRRDRLVRVGEGAFDIEPSFRPYQPVEEAEVDVATVVVAEEGEAFTPLRAVLFARGELTPFTIQAPSRAARLLPDPKRAIPSPVRDATLDRKRALERRAAALRSAGRIPEAIATFREALSTPLELPPEDRRYATKANLAWWSQRTNGRVHLALAEIALDEGRVADAEAELAARDLKVAAGADDPVEVRRKILRARLALRAGDPRTAFGLLHGVLALEFVQGENDTFGDTLRREKFRVQREGRGGDYLLFATAAYLTDRA